VFSLVPLPVPATRGPGRRGPPIPAPLTPAPADQLAIDARGLMELAQDDVKTALLRDPGSRLDVRPSRPGEFHPEPLTDPDLTLSRHPARATARRLPPSIEYRVPPVAG